MERWILNGGRCEGNEYLGFGGIHFLLHVLDIHLFRGLGTSHILIEPEEREVVIPGPFQQGMNTEHWSWNIEYYGTLNLEWR